MPVVIQFIIIEQEIIVCMNDYDSFLTTISEKEKSTDISQPKFISATKWQNSMIENLQYLGHKNKHKKNIITDLITIVSSVPEASLVEATLKIRPFKPEFAQSVPVFVSATQSTLAETITRNIRFSPCKIKSHEELKKRQRVTERTLIKQFEREYHPFKFILKNFKRLLELKFKSMIDSRKINSMAALCAQIKSDVNIFSQFLHRASQPYKKLFTCPANNQEDQSNKFEQFIDTYLQDNEKLNSCVIKVLCYGCAAYFKARIDSQLPDQSFPSDFSLSEQFAIDGGYIRTISSLMEFAEGISPEKLMQKLVNIRENILVDISSYYQDKNELRELEVTAEVQIEILRFCVAKLKGWAVEILTRLKFLEFAYGEEEMGYKYEESSYIYTQLSMVFEIMGIDCEQQGSKSMK